jgi:hypothetical protein
MGMFSKNIKQRIIQFQIVPKNLPSKFNFEEVRTLE